MSELALGPYDRTLPPTARKLRAPLAELHADVQAVLGAICDPIDMTPVSVVDTKVEEYP